MVALKFFFWMGVFLVFYTYIGYGMLLWVLVKMKRFVKGKAVKAALPADEDLPDVTFMVCAYNEQDVVDMKMENTLQFNYPHDKLHIMWVTDGSTDATNDRLSRYPGVEIVFSPERKGKTAALNHGISMVKTDLTIMTDANTMVNPEAVREIVRCFQDPQVACVAGEKRVMARHEGQADRHALPARFPARHGLL
jgi:cellulose synthase/poly-beta-1,6-N-acetylglucosamine synthase-like glycosyltransferase